MNNNKRSILILLGISFIFGIFDFHYQNTIYPLFNKFLDFLGGNENPLLLIPLFIYMLLPWYLLSLYALKVSKKENIFKFKVLIKNTLLVYLISVLSYYLHYVFLLFFVGLPNFENIRFVFSKENFDYAFNTLFLPGVIEWGIGAIVLGFIISLFNYYAVPYIAKHLIRKTLKKKF